MDDEIPEADRVAGVAHPRESAHLFGQDRAATEFLEAYKTGRLHHGWMITGPKGIGKATLAWRIARLLISDHNDFNISPEDPVFSRLAALGDPRVMLLRRPWDADKKRFKANITVDEIRKLNGFFHLSAADGGWRVAIIDAADEMNTPAANALLKILEEPPARTLIILICHQPGRLLPTIRSRCRTLSCERLSEADMALALDSAGFTMPPDMQALTQLADGSVGEALTLAQNEGEELYASIVDALGTIPRLDRGKVLAMADACAGRGAEARYELTRRLLFLALNRFAKAGATGQITPAAPNEAEVAGRLAPHAEAGRAWAELSQTLSTRVSHGVSVNLDPAGVILDTFLQIEAMAARI